MWWMWLDLVVWWMGMLVVDGVNVVYDSAGVSP